MDSNSGYYPNPVCALVSLSNIFDFVIFFDFGVVFSLTNDFPPGEPSALTQTICHLPTPPRRGRSGPGVDSSQDIHANPFRRSLGAFRGGAGGRCLGPVGSGFSSAFFC